MRSMKVRKRGFTLIELAVTAFIVSGLVVAIVAAVGSGRQVAQGNVSAAGGALSQYAGLGDPVVYEVGDPGPGGGIIFYVAETQFACGPTLTDFCTYLEAAPAGRQTHVSVGLPAGDPAQDPAAQWKTASGETPGTLEVLGSGFSNTYVAMGTGPSGYTLSAATHPAAALARAYEGEGKTDWFLPSRDELSELFKERDRVGGFATVAYWSSSEFSTSTVWNQNFSSGGLSFSSKTTSIQVRPVRAF